MKTKILIFASAILMAINVQAQAPEKFNYQGVARDNTGAPLANQALGLQISILNPANTALYVETHSVNTNDFGLYHIVIGDGAAVSGTMGGVNWAGNTKKIKVEIDPSGGTNYTDLGTTELLSVPYALYAASSGFPWTQNGPDISYTNGFVGIGTTSPDSWIEISGAVPNSGRFVNLIPTSISSNDDVLQLEVPNASSGFQFMEAAVGNNNVFILEGDGTIKTDGNVGIGSIATPATSLYVTYAATSSTSTGGDDGFTLENTNGAAARSWNMQVGQSSGNLYLYDESDTNLGTFNGTTGAYTTASDARLKEAILPMAAILPSLMKLEVLSYKFIGQTNEEKHIGFLAQEVEKIFPSVVEKPTNEDGTGGTYTMDYSAFGVIAVKAIQEQQKTIAAQQALIEKMQQRLTALEQK